MGELVAALPGIDRCVVVADENVAALYGEIAVTSLETAGLPARLTTFPAGEASKSRASWAELTDRLLVDGLARDGLVVALGGGVTGDLAGFVASTYLRGVPLVSVPTSLLAMLDSSVGGKTGVDTDSGKNLVGTFHHPVLVVVDPDLLSTLPPRHLRAGMAEGVKMAAIRDATLFETLEDQAAELRDGDPAALLRLIEASVRHKAEVVAADPAEAGLRQILNFGHTAGHALETLSGYTLLHGEAVAAGMRLESRLGEAVDVTQVGTTARLEALLDAVGLLPPERWPGVDALLAAASVDKKIREGKVRWVLLERIGAVAPDSRGAWTHELDDGAVVAGLRAAFPAEADVRDSAS
jgi:3-dehydroquinate synthase